MNAQQLQTWEAEVKYLQSIIDKQADRITELEKQLAFMEGDYPEPTIVEKMKELEKQSEPVAWMYENASGKMKMLGNTRLEEWVTKFGCKEIPLYTTPHHASDVKQTKPLSDEEIYECWEKAGWHKESCIDEDLKFVRAIEAKVRGES